MASAYDFSIEMDGKRKPDLLISRLASTQENVVGRRQLLALGIGVGAIEHRLACARLFRKARGVYAVGTPNLSPDGWRWVAVLAGGPGTVLSHRAAGAIHGIRRWSGVPEVTVPKQRRSRRGLRLYKGTLRPDEITTLRGIPVTTVARTLLDLASLLSYDDMESALRQAEYNGATPLPSLPQLMDRYPSRPGVPMLRRLLEAATIGDGVSKEALEEEFGSFSKRIGLPPSKRNWNIRTRERLVEGDYAWPALRINVELDGWQSHGRRSQFEADRKRDLEVMGANWLVIRITWRRLTHDADNLARDVVDAFAQRSSSEAATAPSRSTFQLPSVS